MNEATCITYTTTEISRICDVYPTTVINWIESGALRAFVTPGGHRRVQRGDLIEFLKKFKIPVPNDLDNLQKRILIVEDDKEMARLLKRAFAKHSQFFNVEIAYDGIAALVRVGQQLPDLMILDIVMPKMNGLQVCEKLSQMPGVGKMKIITISGNKRFTDKDLKDRGIDEAFSKPLSLSRVVLAAARLLRVHLPANLKKSAA
ncbi:response regulator [Elusimicrobiota bacterium]